METGFKTLHRGWTAPGEAGAQGVGDWLGLRARLDAAHSARRQLLAELAVAGPAGGSFAPAAAETIAGFDQALASVNPNDLGDGKPRQGMGDNVTGASPVGDRGLA